MRKMICLSCGWTPTEAMACPRCGSGNVRLVAPARVDLRPFQNALSSPAVWRNVLKMAGLYAGVAALLSRALPDRWVAPGEYCLFAILIAGVGYAVVVCSR